MAAGTWRAHPDGPAHNDCNVVAVLPQHCVDCNLPFRFFRCGLGEADWHRQQRLVSMQSPSWSNACTRLLGESAQFTSATQRSQGSPEKLY